MRRSFIANFTRSSVVGFVALPTVYAQLLSCAEIGCPTDSYTQSTCEINNSRISTLGFTNFTTSLTTEPLSWTVGYEVDPTNVYGNGTDTRFYYLGTPPTLALNSVDSLSGCALYFTGIQGALSFAPAGSSNLTGDQLSGTCRDALGQTCVADLIKQSLRISDDLSGNGTFQCSSLADALLGDPPSSCPTTGNTWGTILAKGELERPSVDTNTDFDESDLTGSEAASTIELGACHPTANQSYDVRMVANQTSSSQPNLFNVVTPILTLFAPVGNTDGSAIGPTLSTSEAYLSCMKPVSDQQPTVVAGGDASRNGRSLRLVWVVLLLSLWSFAW